MSGNILQSITDGWTINHKRHNLPQTKHRSIVLSTHQHNYYYKSIPGFKLYSSPEAGLGELQVSSRSHAKHPTGASFDIMATASLLSTVYS